MKTYEPVDIGVIQRHLESKRSGVSLCLDAFPGDPAHGKGFHGEFDANDIHRLILWWEFQDHTVNQSCTLGGLLPSASERRRVQSFLNRREPSGFNLASAESMELVVVTNDLHNSWLYIIDGNNRAIAQTVSELSFHGVPFFAYEHPEMHKWEYIPQYYKRLWQAAS